MLLSMCSVDFIARRSTVLYQFTLIVLWMYFFVALLDRDLIFWDKMT